MSSLCFLLFIALIFEEITTECKFEYQENIDNYPNELINSIIESENVTNYKKLERNGRKFFCFDDEYELEENLSEGKKYLFRNRIVFDEYEPEEKECEVRKRIIYPKTLTNIINKMMTIVNGPNFSQAMYIEECVNPKQSCREDEPGKFCMCFQSYMKQTLKALDENNQTIIDETFNFPRSCDCLKIRKKNIKIE